MVALFNMSELLTAVFSIPEVFRGDNDDELVVVLSNPVTLTL